MTITIKEMQYWEEKIQELVKHYKLNCYPQEFDICDHHEMIGYMAYSGMPSRYSHWSFGKSFEKQKTMYDYGVSGLPYEMVINSNPCLAYLMRDNSLCLQILTIAHVYGHNDFFANNFNFTNATRAEYTLEMFKNHAKRIDQYIEDPSIGAEKVENWIEHCHALEFQRQKNQALAKTTEEKRRQRHFDNAQPKPDQFSEIHPKTEYHAPDLNRFPIEPEENILLFIAENGRYLEPWQKDILNIVDQEASYFLPQIDTKIMNEGWASYWHYKIMNALELPKDLHLEFLVRHSQVLTPHPGGLNPYHLGFLMWHNIERRWNQGNTGREYTDDKPINLSELSENDTPGRKKIFEIRESDRDTSFLRRFLTEDLIRENNLFQHESRGRERVITKVADQESWKDIKETLVKNTGSSGFPVIKIEDADFGKNQTLYLKHYHDGRDLQLEHAEHCLRHTVALWGREVVLETKLNEQNSILKIKDGTIKIERI